MELSEKEQLLQHAHRVGTHIQVHSLHFVVALTDELKHVMQLTKTHFCFLDAQVLDRMLEAAENSAVVLKVGANGKRPSTLP